MLVTARDEAIDVIVSNTILSGLIEEEQVINQFLAYLNSLDDATLIYTWLESKGNLQAGLYRKASLKCQEGMRPSF